MESSKEAAHKILKDKRNLFLTKMYAVERVSVCKFYAEISFRFYFFVALKYIQ